jgi:hypothetical protein
MSDSRSFIDSVKRLAGHGRLYAKPMFVRHTQIGLIVDGLEKNPHGWVVERNRILRHGIEITWRGDFHTAKSLRVRIDGERYLVTSNEATILKRGIRALLSRPVVVEIPLFLR